MNYYLEYILKFIFKNQSYLECAHGGKVQNRRCKRGPHDAPPPRGLDIIDLSLCCKAEDPQECVQGDHGPHSPMTQSN